jgi:hypothetical protein
MKLTTWIPVLAALVGGLIVAVFNYFVNRKRSKAEIKKIEAETDKLRSELSANIEDAVNYKVAHMQERVIYNGLQGSSGYDFEGHESHIYVDNKPTGIKAKGDHLVDRNDGIINIQRNNAEGRYELWLRQYLYDDRERESIPKDEFIAGQRKVRVSCEAKVIGGEHTLRFVLKGSESGKWLANKKARITQNEWTPIDMYFQIPATEDCKLRIDDQDVSRAPSSIQIRNLVLAEKISEVDRSV